jgi:hypothetical protein
MTVTEHIYYLPLTKSVILSCGTAALCLILIAFRAIIVSDSVIERLIITGILIATAHIAGTVYSSL